ncbi:hypothetical protein [Alkalibacillus haloalkaliphilus]|uniref:hypothetical protein n=1 Tax=Alkalibacillus haloalkaliphilus TaxID=94136 RepID=UPI002935C61A|nr:hypothetical protein [Alkalibacillus haloalkaliphilus]MDV2581697.1 hypothetical protein [Alkalibacillus haloalkaliphilus]
MAFLILILVPFFLVALYIQLKFHFGSESKNDRNNKILLKSYRYAAPIFPIGWLLIELYDRFVHSLSFDFYKDYLWVLLLLIFIVQGFFIVILKKRNNAVYAY